MNKSQLLLFILTIITISSLHAQLKVKDSSEKKQPGWIQNPEQGTIVTKGEGINLEEAKNKAIESGIKIIKEKAIDNMQNENAYFKSLELDENAASKIFISSGYYANLKVGYSDGMYWELLRDKKTKKESYNYYQKYSLTPENIAGIVQLIADERIAALLDTLQNQLNSFVTIDDLKKVWERLMFLNPVFPDNDKNKIKSEALLQQVENTFKQIEIVEMMSTPGKIVVTQMINDKVLESTIPPVLKSECARLINSDRSREKWTIDYSYSKCSSTTPFTFTLEFDNGFSILSKEFTVNPRDEKLEVKMSNTDIIIKGNNITFYVSSLYRKKLILDKIIIHYNDLNFTDTPMHQVLDGAGLYNITFNLPPDFDKVNINDHVRGELYYHSERTGQKGTYRFFNHRIQVNR